MPCRVRSLNWDEWAAGRGSYTPVITNKEQTQAAVEKMRHGTVKKSRGRSNNKPGGGGRGRDGRGKRPLQQWAVARQQLKQCLASIQYYSEQCSHSYTHMPSQLSQGPLNPELSKDGSLGVFHNSTRTTRPSHVDHVYMGSTESSPPP